MKAVNLVPKDYRRGKLAGRGGEIFSYFVIGGLAVILLAVVAVVLTGNKISDNKAEIAKLQQQSDEKQAEAAALAPYSNFASLAQARTATVSSLAQSRFDWERVMHELAEVLPAQVWLTKLTGTVSPEVTLADGSDLTTRSSITGPALEITGCAASQDEVAGFVAALEDIDGVTRVGLEASERSTDAAEATSGDPSAGGTTDDCRTRAFIYQFKLIAAFDAAPTPASAAAGAATAAPPATTSTTPTTPATPAPPAGGDENGAQQQASAQQSVQGANTQAQQATNYVPGN